MLPTKPTFPWRAAPAAQQPVAAPAQRSRTWLRWAVPALAFLLGVAVGGGSSSESEVTASPQYLQLQNELEQTEDEASQLNGEIEEARAQIERATKEGEARLQQQAARLEQRNAQLTKREKAIATRETALRSAERQAAAPAPAPAPVVVPEPAPQAPTSAHYANCDAARAAGAAPVRVGDPGYGGHLDRDGDGVACE